MQIMMFAIAFPPENNGHAIHMYQLAQGLANRGHSIIVITGYPREIADKTTLNIRRKLVSFESTGNLKVVRNFAFSFSKKTFFGRTANFISLSLTTLLGGILAGGADVVYAYTPPLPFAAAALLVAKLRGIPAVLNVQDIYPDAAINVGYIKKDGWIAKILGRLESFVYKNSTAIAVISRGFAVNIRGKIPDPEKISIISNWVDTDSIIPLKRKNEFAINHGLINKFVLLYAGTIGLTSGAQYLLNCARKLQGVSDIHFLFVGGGVIKDRMMQETDKMSLSNVSFLSFQPEEIFPQVLATGDICLVTLGPEAGKSSMPIKTLAIMSAGRPVLAAVGNKGDIANLIKKSYCGIVCESQDADDFCRAVISMRKNKKLRKTMSLEARKYAVRHFGINRAVRDFERLFQKVIDQEKSQQIVM